MNRTVYPVVMPDGGRSVRRSLVVGALGLMVLSGFSIVAPSARSQVSAETSNSIQLGRGKSRIIDVGPYAQLLVGDPSVADVVPATGHSFSVFSKSVGVTTVSVYGPNKKLITTMNVYVNADVNELKSQIHTILPEETGVSVSGALDRIVLSGSVTSASNLKQILDLAHAYSANVVNMMGVEGTQQVMLSVRFVEMERSVAKGLNLSFQGLRGSGNPILQFIGGNAAVSGINTQGSGGLTKFIVPTTAYGAGAAVINGDLGLEFDALETRGLTKTLAEPTLVAMSGESASFLAGGEIPIPVPQTGTGNSNTITIDYKKYGILLNFTPTILKDGLINLLVNPEVSSVDTSVSTQFSGFTVPGFKVRQATTTIELRDGESFVIAGLLSDNYQNTINSLPFVSDIPVLGALFRSPSYKKDQTELVVIVTPHLSLIHISEPTRPY